MKSDGEGSIKITSLNKTDDKFSVCLRSCLYFEVMTASTCLVLLNGIRPLLFGFLISLGPWTAGRCMVNHKVMACNELFRKFLYLATSWSFIF